MYLWALIDMEISDKLKIFDKNEGGRIFLMSKLTRLLKIVFVALILLAYSLPAFAATTEAQQAAESLSELGLFQGTEKGFELDRAPTRQEAVVMLVRLLGQEKTAQNGAYQHPFTDVASWASPYVGYAYQNGLAQGTGATTFGGQQLTTAPQYLTFVLRALGYRSETDFSWQEAPAFAGQIGLTGGYQNATSFTRGDAAVISWQALSLPYKGSETTLLERLQQQGGLTVQTPSSGLQVHFLDVGQADCTLIQVDGKTILIDAGNAGDDAIIIPYLEAQGVTRIDHLIATHAHADHIGAMTEVVTHFDIGNFYMSKAPANTKTYENLLDAVAEKGLKIKSPSPGSKYPVGKGVLTFLSPGKSYEDLNNNSLVCKLVYGNQSLLFTGDMEDLAEQDLLAAGYNPQALVLKVAHHGSDSSSTQQFLNAVKPAYAIVSVGKDNSYGHPSATVLTRLQQLGATIYRTDQQGTVLLRSDGNTLTFSTSSSTASDTQTAAYIGNRNSKKFHLPTCTSLPIEKNRILFSSREKAIEEGYTPCGICQP